MGRQGSVTRLIIDLRSDEPALREAAARPVWGRYFKELLVLARNHLSARIRCQEDEENVLLRGSFIGGLAGVRVYSIYLMNCYDAACLFAALSKRSLQDQGITVGERQRLSQRALERALDLLDRMRVPGEFGNAIPLDEIRKEPLLDPLRSNPGFQRLMMNLSFPDNPFAAGVKSP
jgi:hypothetical protein